MGFWLSSIQVSRSYTLQSRSGHRYSQALYVSGKLIVPLRIHGFAFPWHRKRPQAKIELSIVAKSGN
jgi:hypothetical protein